MKVLSKNIILGILFIVFLAFIIYSLLNSNPTEGMSQKKPLNKSPTAPTPPSMN